jgi:hypothetical protein
MECSGSTCFMADSLDWRVGLPGRPKACRNGYQPGLRGGYVMSKFFSLSTFAIVSAALIFALPPRLAVAQELSPPETTGPQFVETVACINPSVERRRAVARIARRASSICTLDCPPEFDHCWLQALSPDESFFLAECNEGEIAFVCSGIDTGAPE